MQHLEALRVGEPPADRRIVDTVHCGRIEPGRRAVVGRHRDAGQASGPPTEPARHRHADRPAHRCVLLQPAGDPTGTQDRGGQIEARLGLGLHRVEVLVEPVAQDPELEGVEDLVYRLPVPAPPQRVRQGQRQLQVADQPVELVVAQHVSQARAQAVPRLALDLVDMGDQAVDVAVLDDPLGRRLRSDARDAGQVVAGLADQGGEVPVPLGADPVPLHDRRRIDPGQVGDALARVQHGDPVTDELERVPVAGADEHLVALVPGLAGQRGDHVVGLVPGQLHGRYPQRVEHLVHQAHLAEERRRGLRPAGLVLLVPLGAERAAGHVEGHRDVRGSLVAQHVDQHRGEPEDGVGRLTGRGGEVLHRQGEERAVGQGVPVEQQEPGRCGTHVGEPSTPV